MAKTGSGGGIEGRIKDDSEVSDYGYGVERPREKSQRHSRLGGVLRSLGQAPDGVVLSNSQAYVLTAIVDFSEGSVTSASAGRTREESRPGSQESSPGGAQGVPHSPSSASW